MSSSKSWRFDLGQSGEITGFFIGKLVVAVAVMALLGSTISLNSTLRRQTDDEGLLLAAQSISDALSCASSLPGDVELSKKLPEMAADFKVTISGSWENGLETLNIRVVGEREVKHSSVVEHRVNGGNFTVSAANPRNIRVIKNRGQRVPSILGLHLFLLGFGNPATVQEISMELS